MKTGFLGACTRVALLFCADGLGIDSVVETH
jgi:hypothetical protein